MCSFAKQVGPKAAFVSKAKLSSIGRGRGRVTLTRMSEKGQTSAGAPGRPSLSTEVCPLARRKGAAKRTEIPTTQRHPREVCPFRLMQPAPNDPVSGGTLWSASSVREKAQG